MENEYIEVGDLMGKTLSSVENKDGEMIIFTTTDGEIYHMHHDQDCCESVDIESIVGDLTDLIGNPILMAEEVSSEKYGARNSDDESFTWTFYKFATIKGYVDIRWYGTSNGYYSESVSFRKVRG